MIILLLFNSLYTDLDKFLSRYNVHPKNGIIMLNTEKGATIFQVEINTINQIASKYGFKTYEKSLYVIKEFGYLYPGIPRVSSILASKKADYVLYIQKKKGKYVFNIFPKPEIYTSLFLENFIKMLPDNIIKSTTYYISPEIKYNEDSLILVLQRRFTVYQLSLAGYVDRAKIKKKRGIDFTRKNQIGLCYLKKHKGKITAEFYDPATKYIYKASQGDTSITKIPFLQNKKSYKINAKVRDGIKVSGFLNLNYPAGLIFDFGYRYGALIEINSQNASIELSTGKGYEFMFLFDDYVGFNYTFTNMTIYAIFINDEDGNLGIGLTGEYMNITKTSGTGDAGFDWRKNLTYAISLESEKESPDGIITKLEINIYPMITPYIVGVNLHLGFGIPFGGKK